MTDVKRHYHDLIGTPEPDDNKKLHTKPGRKPIETEPKSKRTAQNRAAQRAYRERKEKKMKDLEDKVKDLEDENVRINTESDFLKAQVDMLKNELTKYRGGDFDFSSIKLPSKVGALSKNSSSNLLHSSSSSNLTSESDSSSSVNNSSPETDISSNNLRTEFPWSYKNLASDVNVKDKLPELTSGSSSSESPLNDNILMDSSSKFDEQVDPFCNELNSACGRKDNLMAQYQKKSDNDDSIFGKYFNDKPSTDGLMNENFFGDQNFNFNLSPNDNDPLSFLNDNNFDVNLAFDENKSENISPIDNLINEESAYDPLKDQINTNFNFNDFIKSSLPSEPSTNSFDSKSTPSVINDEKDDNEVVPAPEKTYKCSEIWDRITSHPRYTEIDIDGLCAELKTKAKCSEKGVVINATDVNALLEASAQRR